MRNIEMDVGIHSEEESEKSGDSLNNEEEEEKNEIIDYF